MSINLLLIEDDVALSELLKYFLTKNGFEVQVANRAKLGLQMASASHPDVVLLDIMLPDMDGWQICSQLRKMSESTIIIMLTALSASENVVRGLDIGADDYVVKPVGTEELLARIRALLRRVPNSSTPDDPGIEAINGHDPAQILKYGDLRIDRDKHEVTKGGKPIDLSPTEFRLLSILVRYHGRVLPHEFLVREVWGPDYAGRIDYLRLYISYLRHKLEPEPSESNLIQSEWGIGYRFG